MIKYVGTTTLILIWCLVFGWLWAGTSYAMVARGRCRRLFARFEAAEKTGFVILPALVLAPLALVLMFRLFRVNLLFPLHFFASVEKLMLAAVAPSLVLLLASGLFGGIASSVSREYRHWRRKTFAYVALAMGKDLPRELRRLVLIKSLTGAWLQSLPWLFGELIIVEAVFNAPGLGLDAWNLARMRDYGGLAQSIYWLAILYGVFVVASAAVHRWLGRRLESYS